MTRTRWRNFFAGPVLPAVIALALLLMFAALLVACSSHAGTPALPHVPAVSVMEDDGPPAAAGLALPYTCGAVTCDKVTLRWDGLMSYRPPNPVWYWRVRPWYGGMQ